MLVRVNLNGPWQALSTAIRQGECITIYRYGSDDTRCFLICRNGLRRDDVLKQVVEATLEADVGGTVVTILRLAEGRQGPPLSRVLAAMHRSGHGGG